MTTSLSDTPAMVNDTIAGVKILGHNNVTDTTGVDTVVTTHAMLEKDRPVDFLDSAKVDAFGNYTINAETDSAQQSIVLKELPGVKGIPLDDNIIRNDAVTGLVLLCFFITITIFSVSRDYILRQTKRFFSNISKSSSFSAETINEVKLNFYFVIQTCLIFSLITYIGVTFQTGEENSKFPITLIIPIATIAYTLYCALKYILYIISDSVFYDDRKITRQHTYDFCYIMMVQGILLFPILLLAISSGIDASSLSIYVAVVVVFAKLLAFYKAISTFSGHYKSFLQIILYFCALEMIPLMSLCGILVMIAKYL